MIRFFLNKYINKSISSVLLVSFLISNFLIPVRAFALTSGPSQPEFGQFSPAGASEMVNLFTGDFSYNIPLMDVEGYPLNISYQAGSNMEEEASWVGLGWNINTGAVNRGLRGLPDDFDGDQISRSINIKDHEAMGGFLGIGGELAGSNVGLGFGVATGGTFDNYRGFGSQIATDIALSGNLGKSEGGAAGSLTGGVGLDISSNDGANFRWSVGLSAGYSQKNANGYGVKLGANYSPSVNSRSGVWNHTWNFNASVQKKNTETDAKGNIARKGSGVGVNFSTTILASSTAYLPQIPFDTKSSMWSMDLKIGFGSCFGAFYGTARGYYSKSKILNVDRSYNGFGYMNEEKNATAAFPILDFNREKDGVIYKESPNMAVTSHNYDMFSASGQGFSGSFRAHRNDIGVVFDAPASSSSNGNSLGAEIAFGDGVNIGVNYSGVFSNGESGKWTANNPFGTLTDFSSSSTPISDDNSIDNTEKYYLAMNGEKTPVDAVFYNSIGNKAPVSSSLSGGGGTYSTGSTNYKGASTAIGDKQYLSNKKSKNQFVRTLNAEKAKYLAVEKNIKSYPSNVFALNANGDLMTSISPISRTNIYSYSGSKKEKHISEITATNTDGSRYVYGIPVYNLFQKSVTFNSSVSLSNPALAPDANNYVTYNHGSDNSKTNGHGRDNYYEANVTPPYAHSYLLTSVLSSDFVDLTSDGPTTDDYGNYVKFNFTKESPYAWRIPASTTVSQAHHSFGSLADLYDDKGSYTYGIKDVWYSHSVETKNFVAEFVMESREDSKGVDYFGSASIDNFEAESSKINNSSSLKRLKEIRLYNKMDLLKNGTSATPIKVVHFDYDYSLCKNVPNNSSGTGKLTLKKIWFTYGNSTKGVLSPYEFAYNDQLDHDFIEDSGINNANPNYNPTEMDRWGSYKKPNSEFPLSNILYPYTQQKQIDQDKYARSWCLNTIKTPSGGAINIDYESDDYAYLMEKRPGQMFGILGYSNDLNLPDISDLNRDKLYTGTNVTGNYVFIDISKSPSGLYDASGAPLNYIPGSGPNAYSNAQADKYVRDNYLASNNGKLFFKVKVQLTDKENSYEYIPGYADIANSKAVKVDGSSDYNAIAIRFEDVASGDKKHSSETIHPITKAALQYGRKYLNDVMYPYTIPGSTPNAMQMIEQVGGLLSDFKALIGGVNHSFIKKGFCANTTPAESFVRLTNPNYKKLGGGLRVKQISVSDGWNQMVSSEQTHSYSQTYNYTTKDVIGNTLSTGVASYEPLLGGDENSYRYPVISRYPSNLSINDELMIENPVGESLLPNAIVGYSKVTVENKYDNASGAVTVHGTGKREYEFYTNKDFPYKFSQTGIERQIVTPKGIKKFIKFKSEEKMYVTQGYAIKVNDMHGKPKSVRNYAEGQGLAISGVDYFYKHNGNELDNNVNVINSNNVISTKEVGVDIDIVNDSRMGKQKTQSFSISANICTFTCSYYIPLLFIWPGYSKINNEFYSFGTTKTIQQFGLLDEIVAFDNNSIVKTKNELYDETTGEVVMTKTNNQYNDPVYDFVYPAHWAYRGMGPAYKSTGTKFLNLVDNNGKNIISAANSIITGGDEVAIYDATLSHGIYNENLSSAATQAWVIKDLAFASTTLNEFFLIDKNGDRITGLASGNKIYEIVRSGSRNMQNVPIGSVTTKQNPHVGNALVFDATKQIINTSATEFDDKWNLYCPSSMVEDEVCTPVVTTDFGIYQKLFNCYLVSMRPRWVFMGPDDYNASRTTIYWGQTGSISFGIQPSQVGGCSISMSELNTLLTSFNGLPATSSLNSVTSGGTTKWYAVNLIVKRNASNNLEISVEIEQWQAAQDPYPTGTISTGSCVIVLSKVSQPLINNTQFLFPNAKEGTFSNFTTGISGQGANICQVNYYNSYIDGFGYASSFNGLYQGSIPCVNLYTTLNCTTVSCPAQNVYINPYFENIRGNWKAKRSYSFLENRNQASAQANAIMKGDIREDGYYTSYKPFWNLYNSSWTPLYKLPVQNTDPFGFLNKWVVNSELNKADRYGNVLQTQNTLRKPSAAVYGYNFTRSIASAGNALYTDIAFDGFEDYDYVKNGCIEHFKFYQHKALLSQEQAHTGKFSLKLAAGITLSLKGSLNDSCGYDDNLSIQYGTAIGGNDPGDPVDETPENYSARVATGSGIYLTSECDCAGRFGPITNNPNPQKYIISLWVKQLVTDVPNINNYAGVGANFILNGTQLNSLPVNKSKLIDGWQKLDYEFSVPANTTASDWEVQLYNTSGYITHFDDFRIHPFNAGMVSTVYDPYSLRLWADLDDRNFATFYEYDDEGTLVRVKKETEKGIYTIKEVRSGVKKRP